jgi:hypothetical protein
MLFDAHWHGLRVFGGVLSRGIYDNMKTAVDRVGLRGVEAAEPKTSRTSDNVLMAFQRIR